ncbi:DNA adenine methylase [Sphingopyxis sp. NJF-3]
MSLGHYTPLRYPGGKGKLAKYIKQLIIMNDLCDGTYVEPYAGGAAIACEILLENFVRNIHINDLSVPIFSFWYSVKNFNFELCKRIENAELTVAEWDRQKAIFKSSKDIFSVSNALECGFSAFYLNRANRSGILNGGIIGGRAQSGDWKIDARFNRPELADRVSKIGSASSRIEISMSDAADLLKKYSTDNNFRTLIYLDPPYFEKGRQLYYNYYEENDHEVIAGILHEVDSRFSWVVSYDSVRQIAELYRDFRSIEYSINYSARSAGTGRELMFFDDRLIIPDPIRPMHAVPQSVAA